MHVEICACLRLLARLNYIMGDHPEVGSSYLLQQLLHKRPVDFYVTDVCVFTRRLSATSKRLS